MAKNTESGTEFVHRSKGKANAKGSLDVLKPGDPGYGEKASSELPRAKGPRVEREKAFQVSEDDDPETVVRVIVPDPTEPGRELVAFSGNEKMFKALKKALSKESE